MSAPSSSRNPAVRWVALGVFLAVVSLVSEIALSDRANQPEPRKIDGYTEWSKDVLRTAEVIPLQDGGRVKPLSSFAGFTMLRLHGTRSMRISVDNPDKDAKKPTKTVTLTPTAWLLDCLFRPQFAVDLPTFRIDNSSAVRALGLKPGERRDRYSYRDLEPARDKLIELAQSYESINQDKRDPEQQQTIDLAYNLRNFEGLIGHLAFARSGVTLDNLDGTSRKTATLSTVMAAAPVVREQIAEAQNHGTEIKPHLKALLEQVLDGANLAKNYVFLLPPAGKEKEEWESAGNAIMNVMTAQSKDPAMAQEDIAALETAAAAMVTGNPEYTDKDGVRRNSLEQLRTRLADRAAARGEYRAVPLEASYYRMDWFYRGLTCFVAGGLCAGLMWVAGRNLWGAVFTWITGLLTLTGAVLCAIAIVQRCIIMERPPVGNLYDTIIFIGTTIVFLALVVELFTWKRFALGLAPFIGAALLWLARLFEMGDAKDHMDPLVAVLNSNYWLSIHVLTITLGYTGGLLTAVISMIYIILRGTGLDEGDRSLRRTLTRAAYGCVCLTLFLSLIGTILGGIWANDSWGRFWGWDPKENGALLIVLWCLVILHARLGGYLKEWSLHLACVFGANIVVFSWWHVNFFSTGLHNYGFTAGKKWVWLFYSIDVLFIAAGAIAWAIWNHVEKNGKGRKPSEPQGLPDPRRA